MRTSNGELWKETNSKFAETCKQNATANKSVHVGCRANLENAFELFES